MGKIICSQGLEILRELQNAKDATTAFLRLKGVERIEQLTASEIRDLSEMTAAFNEAVLTPKDVRKVDFVLTLKYQGEEYAVVISRIMDLDLTVKALDLLENFNYDEIERIPAIIGCIYANNVRQALNLSCSEEKTAYLLTEAIREQADFSDVYSVYVFFVIWKENYSPHCPLSKKQLMRCYRKYRRSQKPIRLITTMLLASSTKRSNRFIFAIKKWLFIKSISVIYECRSLWDTMRQLPALLRSVREG